MSNNQLSPQNFSQSIYDRPTLVIDPGKHTAIVRSMDVDTAGLWLVTGGDDKTVRIWSLVDNSLFRTIRLPAGPGHIGKVYAVAISPDSKLIAVGGWMRYTINDPQENIYLYDRETGAQICRIQGLPAQVCDLSFSHDGNILAATLGSSGLRIYQRDRNWIEIARDEEYGAASHAAEFASDGRLATTCFDGGIRLYSMVTEGVLRPTKIVKCKIGLPRGLAFSSFFDKDLLAVGFDNKTLVEIRDGHDLSLLNNLKYYDGPENITSMKDLHIEEDRMLSYGSFRSVAWSNDGILLFAAGGPGSYDPLPIVAWPATEWSESFSRGIWISVVLSDRALTKIIVLPNGDLLASGDNGTVRHFSNGDMRSHWDGHSLSENPLISFIGEDVDHKMSLSEEGYIIDDLLSVSSDGTIVDFRYSYEGFARFDVNSSKLTIDPPSDNKTIPTCLGRTFDGSLSTVKIGDIRVEGWIQKSAPPFALFGKVVEEEMLISLSINGYQIMLDPNEHSICLAAHPNGESFVLGCEFSLRLYNGDGELVWKIASTPVFGVNITGNGKLIVAAYADNTIRWHRTTDGVELLAFTMKSNGTDWVAWTPEGFYCAPGTTRGVTQDLLRWHSNQGWDASAISIPIHEIPGSFRPAVLQMLLTELNLVTVIGKWGIQEHNRQIMMRTHSQFPPGVHLHLLAIGISRYNSKYAKNLQLKFADADARAFAECIRETQEGGLYSKVHPQLLLNEEAKKDDILNALNAFKKHKENHKGISGVSNFFVIFFSGHGDLIDGEFYLMPQDVNASDREQIERTGLEMSKVRRILLKLANSDRVLLLLDACHSGAITTIGEALMMDSTGLRIFLAGPNVNVFTSSSGYEKSREDPEWRHGAFTKAILDSFNPDHGADSDRNGLISCAELANYVTNHVSSLTNGEQSPDMLIGSNSILFASGL